MNYREAKEQVLKQYDELLPMVEEIKGSKETTYDTILKHMKQSAEEVRNDRFVLMVIGEAKAGKSTFINAYLGKDIMPMDENQCTSSIIEVRYGEKYTLKAIFADGRTQTVEGDAKIKEFLTANAAISDEYRDIPVGIINLQFLIPKKGRPAVKEEMQAFMRTIQAENIFGLSKEVYESKVRQYIEAQRMNWGNIVEKMEIEFPFKDAALRSVVIVDSPGVGARGGVGTVTEKYLDNADAVMFLKAIGGQAMESNAFCDFMESVVAKRERNRRAIFLILTRKGAISKAKVRTNMGTAVKLFSRYIDKDQIIAVDSLAELFRLNGIMPKTEEEVEAFMEGYEESDDCEPFLLNPWGKTQNREAYLAELREISNFDNIDEALNRFARTAHFFLLHQLTREMLGTIDSIISNLNEQKAGYEEKLQGADKIAMRLVKKRTDCAATRQKIHITAMQVEQQFIADPDGIIIKRANDAVQEFEQAISAIDPSSEDSVTRLEALTEDRIAKFEKLQGEIRRDIIRTCNEALIESTKASEISYEAIMPSLDHQTLEQIKEESREKAYVLGDAECFRKPRLKFDQRRFFDIMRNKVMSQVSIYQPRLVVGMQRYAGKIRDNYLDELGRNLRIQEKEYEQILEDQRCEEELQKTIEGISFNVKQMEKMREQVGPMEGGLTDYVGSRH